MKIESFKLKDFLLVQKKLVQYKNDKLLCGQRINKQ